MATTEPVADKSYEPDFLKVHFKKLGRLEVPVHSTTLTMMD